MHPAIIAQYAIGLWRINGSHGDQTGGQADQAVKGRDQLRHGGHGHAPSNHGPDNTADGDATKDKGQRNFIEQVLAKQG